MAFFPAHNQSSKVRHRLNRQEAGTALVEFVLATGLLILPFFFAIILLGLGLILANQVTEVCRDTGHMFAYRVDFSQTASQLLVTNQLAQGLGMTPTGGKGVIYLSLITYVDSTSCAAAGLGTNSTSCPNINQIVVTQRLVIGNSAVQSSTYAPSITPSIIQSSGNIGAANYLTDPSVRASNFSSVISLSVSQYAYVSEMFVQPPSVGMWALLGSNILTSRSVF